MPFPNELRAGADVYSSDGHKLGELHRAVLRRTDLGLAHIAVDIGFLRSGRHLWEGGLGLDYDRLVPADAIAEVTPERVTLRLSAEQFKNAPPYNEDSLERAQVLTPDQWDVPDLLSEAQRWNAAFSTTGNFWLVERLNKPLDEVDIAEGTPVWRREPHQKLGEVHRLLLDPQSGRLRAFVVTRGFIFTHEVVLPARFIAELLDDIVRVDISDAQLSQMRPYEPD